MSSIKKIKLNKKDDTKYTSQSFVVYTHSKNGNFSTSASCGLENSQDNDKYQVRNKITESIIYATKRS